MQEQLARIRALMEPAGAGRDVAYGRDAHARRYADDAHVFFPGTWFMAGHHRGRIEVDKMWEAVRVIWPQGTRLFRNHFFVGEDTIAIEWWSRNVVWNGVHAQNSGVGRLRFRGDQVIDHHEITDSEYFEEIHGDWRSHLDPDLGRHLPKYSLRGRPHYPEDQPNEWAHDDSPTDGRNCAPAESQANLAVAIEWWEGRSGSGGPSGSAGGHDTTPGTSRLKPDLDVDLQPFSADVDVFFQGRVWPLGGHHRGRAALERLCAVSRRLWPESRIVKANFWAAENRVLIEWFREARTWTGRACREGAFTVWEFDQGKVSAVRTYVDTSYWAEVLEGWRAVVGRELGAALPNWPEPGNPRHPQPERHE